MASSNGITADYVARFANWIQVGILILAILGFWFGIWEKHLEDERVTDGRITRMEQRVDDLEKELDRYDGRIRK
jgi:hypothetical protein